MSILEDLIGEGEGRKPCIDDESIPALLKENADLRREIASLRFRNEILMIEVDITRRLMEEILKKPDVSDAYWTIALK